MNDGFIFYSSFYEAISELGPDDKLAVYEAICRYGLYSEVPDGNGIVSAIFKLVRPQIDANNKRREAGRRGGDAKASNVIARLAEPVARSGNDVANCSNGVAKEKGKEKGKGKEKEEKTPAAVIASLDATEGVRDKLREFAEMRTRIKKPMTARAVTLLWAELQKLSKDPGEQEKILDQSILHSWQSVYPLKAEKARERPKNAFNNYSMKQSYDFGELERAL